MPPSVAEVPPAGADGQPRIRRRRATPRFAPTGNPAFRADGQPRAFVTLARLPGGSMPRYDFDLFVLGAGSGGVRASRMSAGYGARVAVAESGALGGTCVNVGCIPKKLLVYASMFREEWEDAAGFGWSAAEPQHDWATLIANKDLEIARLNGVYARLLDQAGVTRIEGRGRIVDPHRVAV